MHARCNAAARWPIRLAVVLGLCLASGATVAQGARGSAPDAVLVALSKRSRLPVEDLRRRTADCAADQAAVHLCAWRDAIRADLDLRRAIDDAARQAPACRAAFARQLAAWRTKLDAGCRKVARKDWNGGSMEPAAALMCQAISIDDASAHLQAPRGCRLRLP